MAEREEGGREGGREREEMERERDGEGREREGERGREGERLQHALTSCPSHDNNDDAGCLWPPYLSAVWTQSILICPDPVPAEPTYLIHTNTQHTRVIYNIIHITVKPLYSDTSEMMVVFYFSKQDTSSHPKCHCCIHFNPQNEDTSLIRTVINDQSLIREMKIPQLCPQ